MELTQKAIEELKEIYYQETGEKISDKEAKEMGENLLFLFKIICRPIPEVKRKKNFEPHPLP